MENPIKMDDLGVAFFLETPMSQALKYHRERKNSMEGMPQNQTGQFLAIFYDLFFGDGEDVKVE